jgi:peptidoglycan hydrolase-like protein with peptidoglycan-binding domain
MTVELRPQPQNSGAKLVAAPRMDRVLPGIALTNLLAGGLGSPAQGALQSLGHLAGNRALQRLLDRSPEESEIRPAADAAPSRDLPVLRLGSSGLFVLLLQQALNDAGIDVGIDGLFGTRTRSAVVAFQSSHDLVPDGVAGPRTWGHLDTSTDQTTDLASGPSTATFLPAGTHAKTPGAQQFGTPSPGRHKAGAPLAVVSDDQAASWFDEKEPYGMRLVGGIFFPTNIASLDPQDKLELDKLVDLIGSRTTSEIDPRNRPHIFIAGNADPRPTTRKGGNRKLSADRALTTYKYLEYELDKKVGEVWKDRITFSHRGFGMSEGLKQFGLEYMRSALLVRLGPNRIAPGPGKAAPKTQRQRARDVLTNHKTRFDRAREWDRLWHICQDSTIEQGFLKSTDPKFLGVVTKGRPSKPWPYAELKAFVNRFTVDQHLAALGAKPTDEEVIGVLRDIEIHADEAIFIMHRNQTQDDAAPNTDLLGQAKVQNVKRKQLINWVADGTQNSSSFYFGWGSTRSY